MSYVGSLGRNRGKRNMLRLCPGLVGRQLFLYLLLETGVGIRVGRGSGLVGRCSWWVGGGSGLVGRGSGWVGGGMVRIRSRFV